MLSIDGIAREGLFISTECMKPLLLLHSETLSALRDSTLYFLITCHQPHSPLAFTPYFCNKISCSLVCLLYCSICYSWDMVYSGEHW